MKTLQITVLAALTLAGTALFAAQNADLPKDSEIARMAESARTANEHAAVAKTYRLKAEAFAEKAEKLEAEVAKKQNGPQIGMSAKWPAMARNSSVQREKQKAIEARRAARESEQLAALHTQLAVEAGFSGSVAAKKSAERSESADGTR